MAAVCSYWAASRQKGAEFSDGQIVLPTSMSTDVPSGIARHSRAGQLAELSSAKKSNVGLDLLNHAAQSQHQ